MVGQIQGASKLEQTCGGGGGVIRIGLFFCNTPFFFGGGGVYVPVSSYRDHREHYS